MDTSRNTLNAYYMNNAIEASKRSTCIRHKMGCVLVKNRLQISGWLGVPSKVQHCTDHWRVMHKAEWDIHNSSKIEELAKTKTKPTPHTHEKDKRPNGHSKTLSIAQSSDLEPIDQLEEHVSADFQRKDYLYKAKTLDTSWQRYLMSDQLNISHTEWMDENEIHPEISVLLQAMQEGISTVGATLYTVHSPCSKCAVMIKAAGIAKVYYSSIWKYDQRGIDFLRKNEISCNHFSCQAL